MQENRPSATAQRVAYYRAAHQLLDAPVVFDDPLALRVLGPQKDAELRFDPRRSEISPFASFLRAFIAARSRLAEDELRLAVERGVGQYVILGAGLDTFALRNPYPAGSLMVFEVDFPATQAWKRACLAEAGLEPPEELIFAPMDFETETLAQGLAKAGLDPDSPALFSWLGVTPYLTPEAITAALGYVAARPPGSGVVFDYAVPRSLLDERGRLALDGLTRLTGAAGEPWQTFFDPAVLQKDLLDLGFSRTRDLGRDEVNQIYFQDRKDGLQVGNLCRLMCARV